jgi:predicted flavoprotein YhiN
MYLAGEVLNIDALTGGFNFQAAWSEAWVISQSV